MRYVYLITNGYDMVLVFRDGICYYTTADASFPTHDPGSVKDFLRRVNQYADFGEWKMVSPVEAEEWLREPQNGVLAEYGEEELR